MQTHLPQFRNAMINDLDALNALMKRSKAYWGDEEQLVNDFMVNFGGTPKYLENAACFVMILNQEALGFYGFTGQDKNELDYFFLEPDYIGKGFGKLMWSHALNTAKSFNWDQFILWSNPGAEAFYIKMGCEKIGTRQSPLAPNRFPSIFRYGLVA